MIDAFTKKPISITIHGCCRRTAWEAVNMHNFSWCKSFILFSRHPRMIVLQVTFSLLLKDVLRSCDMHNLSWGKSFLDIHGWWYYQWLCGVTIGTGMGQTFCDKIHEGRMRYFVLERCSCNYWHQPAAGCNLKEFDAFVYFLPSGILDHKRCYSYNNQALSG